MYQDQEFTKKVSALLAFLKVKAPHSYYVPDLLQTKAFVSDTFNWRNGKLFAIDMNTTLNNESVEYCFEGNSPLLKKTL